MHQFIDYIASKRLIAPSLYAAPGGSSTLYATSSQLITAAISMMVQRAIAAGGIRRNTVPADLLRAMVGVCYKNPVEGWEESAHRLIEILMDGLRRGPPASTLQRA